MNLKNDGAVALLLYAIAPSLQDQLQSPVFTRRIKSGVDTYIADMKPVDCAWPRMVVRGSIVCTY